jgi:SAM-dependent methyltransferase
MIDDQFTRQAAGFAAAPELHNDAVLALLLEAGRPQCTDRMIDVACGPGTVVAAFAPHVERATGLDATPAMLAEASAFATAKTLSNVDWQRGSAYALPYPAATFDIVVSRFAFHHLEDPRAAFAEMVRVTSSGGRIVLCDAVASDDSAKAAAFNAMERWRDPSTLEFRTLGFLRGLFLDASLGSPELTRFQVPYLAHKLVAGSFPARDDRAGLLRVIEDSVDGDLLGMNARSESDGVHIAYQAVILSVAKER